MTRVLLATALFGAATLGLTTQAPAAETVPPNDFLNATLWVGNAVEYKANTIAAFELARIRLDQALATKRWTATNQKGAYDTLPPAIITDIDETLLDNVGFEAWLVKTNKEFTSKTYDEWTRAMQSEAIPGAVEFANYADSLGVKVFYVSNRDFSQEWATRKNMEALGFPMGGYPDTFLMAKERPEWTSKKGTRRDYVSESYRVLLLLGDNYADFSDNYGGSEADRLKDFEANKLHFGQNWIMIANPEYGSFECAPFLCDYKLSADERRRKKIDALDAWSGPTEQ